MKKPEDKKVCLIGDDRLVGYTNRTRSGSTQVFYTGNDSRDWSRYHEERKTNPSADMHDKADTIYIEPPETHYYAKFIEGEWWWVNGCPECNGRKDSFAYRKCVKHDICCDCGKMRSECGASVWGTSEGFRCVPCQDRLNAKNKADALAKFAEEDYDEWDFQRQDDVVCPHCASKYQPESDFGEGEQECDVCGGKYTVEIEYSRTFSTTLIGERVTA